VYVSQDIDLYSSFLKQLTQSLCAFAGLAIEFSKFDETCGSDVADFCLEPLSN
jgi:hypothetical protein